MEFQTMSLVAGNHICNARCPFCVSRMTHEHDIKGKAADINLRNLRKAIQLAKEGGVTSVLITGKGEPTLYPEHITEYLMELDNAGGFPFIELQTNAWLFEQTRFKDVIVEELLKKWHRLGLTTIMISNVGYDMELNHKTYFPKQKKYLDIQKVVDLCHKIGFIVRYTTVGIKGGIDSAADFDKLVEFCQMVGIEQLTWRPVAKTIDAESEDMSVNEWVSDNGLGINISEAIYQYVEENGTKLYDLVHGAAVFDYKGQNVCISSCLTHDPDEKTIRQLIFHPDGKLFTDWQYAGSRLL